MQHTTTVTATTCNRCKQPLFSAWDDGRHARVGQEPLDESVASALLSAGYRVYARTHGGHLIWETPHRAGTLPLVISRHAPHTCPARP